MTTLTEMAKAAYEARYGRHDQPWESLSDNIKDNEVWVLLAALRPAFAPRDLKDAPRDGTFIYLTDGKTIERGAWLPGMFVPEEDWSTAFGRSMPVGFVPTHWLCTTAQLAEIVAMLGEGR
jgi:hypothetical protein